MEHYRIWLEKKNSELPKYDRCFDCGLVKIIRRYHTKEFFSHDLQPWCDDCFREAKAREF